MIKKFNEINILNDYLNYEPETYNKNKVSNNRSTVVKELTDFAKENKKKGNREKVVDVSFDYQLNHSTLSKFDRGDEDPFVIYFDPKDKYDTFPFRIAGDRRWIGFLSDNKLLPISKEMILFVRSEQFERVHYFLKNIEQNKFIKNINYKSKSYKYSNKYKADHKDNNPIEFEIKIHKVKKAPKDWIDKIKLFHVYMFNMLYTSESSFYKGIFKGTWNFGKQLSKQLKVVKNIIKKSEIVNDFSYYDNSSTPDDSLYMFTVPIRNGKIDWNIINSWIDHIKVRILNFANIGNLLDLRSYESALYPYIDPQNKDAYENKESLIKTWVYDASSNGSKYLYWDLKPHSELKSSFKKARKEKDSSKNTSKGPNKDRMDFIEFYMHQYAYKPNAFENLYWLNRITTPKENVKISRVQVII